MTKLFVLSLFAVVALTPPALSATSCKTNWVNGACGLLMKQDKTATKRTTCKDGTSIWHRPGTKANCSYRKKNG